MANAKTADQAKAKFTLGGLIHLLLIIAVIVLVFRLVTGRRPV